MKINVEIVLRERNYAVTERVVLDGNEPPAWTVFDVEQVLKGMLLAIHRVKNPNAAAPRHVALRGFSWIAERTGAGVVIAIEIPSGAAVAGPFDIAQPALDRLIRAALSAPFAERPSVH